MSTQRAKSGITLLASIVALGLLATACGNTAQTKPTSTPVQSSGPQVGGGITMDIAASFKDLDPAKAFDMASGELVDAMYDQLVMYKGTTTDIAPMAAKSYTISPDGKVYTFHLHKNIKFWNGDKMTAQSFIDEFDRILNPKTASAGEGFINPIIEGSAAYYKGTAKSISGISAPDPYTLVIKLTKPEPFFLDVLTMSFFSAVDQKFIDSVGEAKYDSQVAMGTGAFELKKIDSTQTVLSRNPHYWRKDASGKSLPYLQTITVDVTENPTLEAERFKQGDTDILGSLISGIPTNVYPQFTQSPSLKKLIKMVPMVSIWYVDMNVKDKPFNHLKVRQAVEYAVNKKKIIKLLHGRGEAANQPTPPMLPGYNNNLPADATYSYNPTKAKKLLAEAGFTNGFTTTLETFNDPTDTNIISSIAQDLKAVGIDCKVKPMAGNMFLTQYLQGKTPFFFTGYNQDFPDASDFLNTEFYSKNAPSTDNTWYNNPEVDALLTKAQTDTNQQERVQIYQQLNAKLMEDAAQVPIYIPMEAIAVQPWVHGYNMGPTQYDPLSTLWVDKSHQK